MMRNTYFDFLRGVAISMVVAIHTFFNVRFEVMGVDWAVLVRQLLNGAVPIFLAISGYFLSRKSLDTTAERLAFWQKQIPRVYVPCLIWSLPLFSVTMIFGGGKIALEFVKLFVCGYSVYYFVLLIMQYYVLLPFLKPVRRSGLVAAALLSGISILLVSFLVAVKGYSLPLVVYAGPFPLWIVFFVLGIYLAQTERTYPLRLILLLLLCSLVWEYKESLYLYGFHGNGLGIKLSSFVYSFLLILLLFSKKMETWYNRWNSVPVKCMAYLGRISYGVYLTHCYVILLAVRLLPDVGWTLRWAVVLAIDVALVVLGLKLFPAISKKYLGFE